MCHFSPQCSIGITLLLRDILTYIEFFPDFQSFTIRNRSRSIVMGIIVNHELGLTEVRIRQLQSIVDIFVILESRITSGML